MHLLKKAEYIKNKLRGFGVQHTLSLPVCKWFNEIMALGKGTQIQKVADAAKKVISWCLQQRRVLQMDYHKRTRRFCTWNQ